MACACHTFDPSGTADCPRKGAVKARVRKVCEKNNYWRNRQRATGGRRRWTLRRRHPGSRLRFDESVTVADLGTPGLDLVAHLSGIDALILIDSVSNNAPAGTVTLYRKEDILRHGPAPVRMDPHSPALSESLLIAELAGEGPQEILLIGITGEQYEVGTSLSEAARQCGSRRRG